MQDRHTHAHKLSARGTHPLGEITYRVVDICRSRAQRPHRIAQISLLNHCRPIPNPAPIRRERSEARRGARFYCTCHTCHTCRTCRTYSSFLESAWEHWCVHICRQRERPPTWMDPSRPPGPAEEAFKLSVSVLDLTQVWEISDPLCPGAPGLA